MDNRIGPVAVLGALVLIFSGSAVTSESFQESIQTTDEARPAEGPYGYAGGADGGTDIEHEIFYGLNDSHSHSWVQENNQGVVGITYFQRLEGGSNDGSLIYKTIHPDGTVHSEKVTDGTRMERSVLLYDALSQPHIFLARSDSTDQVIDHYYESGTGLWQSEAVFHFHNWGGKFIYELSADLGPDNSFHLLVLKSRSDVDSDDYWNAWMNSYLFHISNADDSWQTELIHDYDMAYTYDHYIKCSCRQDMEIDDDGFVHVAFSQQIRAEDDPSRLLYATNKSGSWKIETALNNDFGARDDAGWFPSLCLDTQGIPHISCMYVNRVQTYSAVYCKLFLLKRMGDSNWQRQIVAEYDDGYYGSDGRCYTGALSHLVFDNENVPHVIFSDIASSHWRYQRLNVGNIRYAVYRNGAWNMKTIYRQPLPAGFKSATEMFGECLIVSDVTNIIRVIGQELEVTGPGSYSLRLKEFSWVDPGVPNDDDPGGNLPEQFCLYQNYPNPFNSFTTIRFSMPRASSVDIGIYNVRGQRVQGLKNGYMEAGAHIVTWDGTDVSGSPVSSGIYVYRMCAGDFSETRKMVVLR